jgi:hypothetical protein
VALYNPFTPLTPRQQRQEALALLKAALLPERQQIKRARLQAQRKTEEESRRAEGLARAVASLQTGVGPATQQGYQAAAQTQGALAKGFSDTIRTGAEADAAAAAEVLARIGAPVAQQQQVSNVGKGAADVAYFQGGYNPATAWAKEGAALAAAQNQLPATTLGRGQQQIGAISKAQRDYERDLDEKLADLEAKAPGTLAQILQGIRQNEASKVATGIQAEYLGLAGQKGSLDTRATVAGITGIDPATGLPTLAAQGATAGATAKRQEARTKATGQKNSAFRSARQDALDLARTLYKGEEVDNPAFWKDPANPRKIVNRPTWAQARQQLWTEIGPDLLRFGGGKAGRNAIKRQAYTLIDQALRAAGFAKPKPPRKYTPRQTRPG